MSYTVEEPDGTTSQEEGSSNQFQPTVQSFNLFDTITNAAVSTVNPIKYNSDGSIAPFSTVRGFASYVPGPIGWLSELNNGVVEGIKEAFPGNQTAADLAEFGPLFGGIKSIIREWF